MDALDLIYYLGIISCAAQGAEKGKSENCIPVLHYIINAFGGGFLRDAFILGVTPWILTSSAIPDLMIVVICGSLYTYYFFIHETDTKQYNVTMQLVTITDALGVGSFIYKGMEAASGYENNFFTTVACGYITAIGGGILASKKSFTMIFENRKTVYYHLVTLLGCCYYYTYRQPLCMVCFVSFALFLTSIEYKNLHYWFYFNVMNLYPDRFLLYPAISSNGKKLQKHKNICIDKKLGICPVYPRIYLVQHRIRQC